MKTGHKTKNWGPTGVQARDYLAEFSNVFLNGSKNYNVCSEMKYLHHILDWAKISITKIVQTFLEIVERWSSYTPRVYLQWHNISKHVISAHYVYSWCTRRATSANEESWNSTINEGDTLIEKSPLLRESTPKKAGGVLDYSKSILQLMWSYYCTKRHILLDRKTNERFMRWDSWKATLSNCLSLKVNSTKLANCVRATAGTVSTRV